MFRIKYKKIFSYNSDYQTYCYNYRYVIQKKILFFFWIKVNHPAVGYYSTLEEAEQCLQNYINEINFVKETINKAKETFYLVKDNKIVSVNSKKESIKKIN